MGGLASFLHPVDPITRKVDPIVRKGTEAAANSGLDPIAKRAWGKEESEPSRPAPASEGGSLLEEKDAKKQLLGS